MSRVIANGDRCITSFYCTQQGITFYDSSSLPRHPRDQMPEARTESIGFTMMTMKRRRALALLASVCILCLTERFATAQEAYPSRPIRLVAPFAAGGGTDVFARRFLPSIAGSIGARVII